MAANSNPKLPSDYVGLLGETLTMESLLWRGWTAINLNRLIGNAANTDLIVSKNSKKVAIQIKTSGLGSTRMLRVGIAGKQAFNSKDGRCVAG